MESNLKTRQIATTLWALWSALTIAPLIFIGIATRFGGLMSEGSPSSEDLPLILGGVSFLSLALSVFVIPGLTKGLALEPIRRATDDNQRLIAGLQAVQTAAIVSWAMCESAALLLGIAVLLFGWQNWSIAVIVLFLFVMALSSPTTDRIATQLETRLEGAECESSDIEKTKSLWLSSR